MVPHATRDMGDFPEWAFDTPEYEKKITLQKQQDPRVARADGLYGNRDAVSPREDQANVMILTDTDLEEVKCAVIGFENRNLALNMINPMTFPLPTLAPKLGQASETIHGDIGHVLIRGLDSIPFTYLQKVIVHTGLTSHIAGKRAMTGVEGDDPTVLHHVTALSTAYFEYSKYQAPSNQAGPLLFHNDNGHILSLFTVSQSSEGGDFYLANVNRIWQNIRDIRPDLAVALTEDWISESPSKVRNFDKRPIVFIENDRAFMYCSRVRISGTPMRPRPNYLPPLSNVQLEALDLLQSTASAVAIKLRFQPGDLLAFNNHGMMHARDAFIDQEGSGQKRHLLRLIAKDKVDPSAVPQPLQQILEKLYNHEDRDEKFDIFKNPFMFAAGH